MLAISSSARWRSVERETNCPFAFDILAVYTEPTSIAGRRYRPSVSLSFGKLGTLSRNITQLYQSNMADVCGTSGHNGLGDLPVGHVDVVACTRANGSLED